jgi:hypothetical protein
VFLCCFQDEVLFHATRWNLSQGGVLFSGVPNSSGSTAGLSGTTAEVGLIPGWTAADLGFDASIYSSCKPPFWGKPHIVNPRRL